MKTVLEMAEDVVSYIKGLGFCYVTLDLEGFRSGSMDLVLSRGPEKPGTGGIEGRLYYLWKEKKSSLWIIR